MGKPVTIDSDDMEAILVAAEYAGKIEDMIRGKREDAQVLRTGGRLRQAVDTARRAWGAAIRVVDDDPIYNEPPPLREAFFLRLLFNAGVAVTFNPDNPDIQALRRKRMVVAGHVVTITQWGDGTAEKRPHEDQVFRLTERGRKWCEENHDA